MPQHTITVWSVAIDSDNPLSSSVRTSEACAWSEVVTHFVSKTEETKKAFELIEAGDFDGLREFVSSIIEKYHLIDSYTVDKHELTIEVPWPSDEGVSDDEHDYGVTVPADVKADSPDGAVKEFVKSLQIGNTEGLTYHVSNLKTGEYVEIDD